MVAPQELGVVAVAVVPVLQVLLFPLCGAQSVLTRFGGKRVVAPQELEVVAVVVV